MPDPSMFPQLQEVMQQSLVDMNNLPKDATQWRIFLQRLNAAFYDLDHERALLGNSMELMSALERSMELSSAEYLEMNEQFELAEAIAHIGHWRYQLDEDEFFCSKELCSILGIPEVHPPLRYHEFINYIIDEDRDKFEKIFEIVRTRGIEQEMELQLYHQVDQSKRWVFVKCRPKYPLSGEESNEAALFNLTGIVRDIDQEKKNELKMQAMNAKMIELSRQAGMSEIAVSVLHNVGNILNSLCVSLSVAREKIVAKRSSRLEKIAQTLFDGVQNNTNFLTDDEKGKLIPRYLLEFSSMLVKREGEVLHELDEVERYVDHIKSIVVMQKEISGVAGLMESVSMHELCEQAIQMQAHDFNSADIQIIKEFEFGDSILVNKSKLLQVIVNMLGNAKDSLAMCNPENEKIIRISVKKDAHENNVLIAVTDTGVGVEKENVSKIFSMGYSSKEHGHGFGLHMSALAIDEMGGKITFSSEGKNKGASFLTSLPIVYSKK